MIHGSFLMSRDQSDLKAMARSGLFAAQRGAACVSGIESLRLPHAYSTRQCNDARGALDLKTGQNRAIATAL